MNHNTARRTLLKTIPAAVWGSVGGTALLGSSLAHADDTWPNKPIRLIVPAAPGGGSDTVGRIVAQALTEKLGQPVLVDNKAGAAGTLGVAVGVQAPADGYTFIWCTPSAQIMAPPSVRYDALKDLVPVSLLVSASYLLVVGNQQPWTKVSDLVAAARAKPGSLNYGTAGTGSFGHYMAASFGLATGSDVVQIPYAGEGPAMVALMRGDVQFAFISGAGALPHVSSGRVRALGVSSASAMEGVPTDIPFVAGTVPGFDLVAINYMSARTGTPQPIVDKMSQAVQAVLAQPAVRERIVGLGVSPVSSTPDALGRRVLAERKKVHDTLKRANIVLE
ncbi:Bug family tripartite tricarboxylate transporter substrate binding protein [Hydrogenophaga sp. BPS33]|uniref:Bug family tripartite tricarboxylate transporter substrate binding protein n=1 Tax=Hydrogenophaga sp. BPS33 TaxID=2651974 RepID=UPI00131FB1F3|nr:tripartite tricarboxylate transporter substrate binding protein [Hydrogenophaga sp. BPS33]QHE84474.1 tripartite tricarboxylate transporter substrate binding protein [Hydrogenophaga sp. BPS33]